MQADGAGGGGGGGGGGSGGASFALRHAHPPAPRSSGTTSEVARSSLDLPEGLPPGDAARLVSGAATSEVARSSLDLPPGDAAEPVAAPAAADHVWQDYNAPAAKRRRLRRSPYFRRGVQCAFGTAAILAVISIPAVFDALSLDPRTGTVFILGEAAVRSRAAAQRMQPCWRSRALRLAGPLPCVTQGGASTPAAASASFPPSCLPLPGPLPVFYFIVLLVALSSGVAPLKVAVEQLLGSALGIGLGLAGACCASLLGRAAWRVRHAGWMCSGAQGPVTQPAMAFYSQTTFCLVAGTCLDAPQLVRALLSHSYPLPSLQQSTSFLQSMAALTTIQLSRECSWCSFRVRGAFQRGAD